MAARAAGSFTLRCVRLGRRTEGQGDRGWDRPGVGFVVEQRRRRRRAAMTCCRADCRRSWRFKIDASRGVCLIWIVAHTGQACRRVERGGGSFKNNKSRFIDLNIVIALFIASTCLTNVFFFYFISKYAFYNLRCVIQCDCFN